MRPSKFSDEQLIGMLKEHEPETATTEVCRKYVGSMSEVRDQFDKLLVRSLPLGTSITNGSLRRAVKANNVELYKNYG